MGRDGGGNGGNGDYGSGGGGGGPRGGDAPPGLTGVLLRPG